MIQSRLNQAEEMLKSATILIVDDEPINRAIASDNLHTLYNIIEAESAERALDICLSTPPDLILLDVVMGGMSGLEMCKILKRNEDVAHIPIIFITAMVSKQHEENLCWEAGGVDFVSKPFNGQTLRNRVKVHLTLKFQQDLLRTLTFVDGLTGLYNRHMLDETLKGKLRDVSRTGNACSLLLIDVDWFKQFNDTYGHLEGDDCLKSVAKTLKECLKRPSDMAFRFGGEEFLAVLPNTDKQGAEAMGGELIEQIERLAIAHESSPLQRLSISVGAYTVTKAHACEADSALLDKADQALYQAKSSGRNRFFAYDEPLIHPTRKQGT